MIKNIIFDLDGTLLNTLDDLTDSTNYMLKQFNYPIKTKEQIKSYIGNGVNELIKKAVPNNTDNIHLNNCIKIFKENYAQNMYNKTAPYKDIKELLISLKAKNYNIAVASNKFDMAVQDLCKRYFNKLIDYCAGENESHGIKKKPSPDIIHKIMNYFNGTNNDTIFVGDSEVDIQTAKNSQIKCINVSWGYKDKDFLIASGANIIIDNPLELINTIQDFNS